MGLLDSLKSAKNYITGGSAEITVSMPEEIEIGHAFDVHVACKALADITPKKVYIILQSVERVKVEGYDFDDAEYERKRMVTTMYNDEVEIVGEQSMQEGKTYEWDISLTIPDDAECTYNGKNATHTWRLQAAIDVPGNDPDSGWVEFDAY